MTDKWFLEDIEQSINKQNRLVILDPKGRADFLLKVLKEQDYLVFETDVAFNKQEAKRVEEELFLRYEADGKYAAEKVIFYVQREQNQLSFLYDYCFTHGCLDLTNMETWLKEKIFKQTDLQVNIPTEKLLTYAKLGMGKGLAWWQKVLQDLEDAVVLKEEILPFLHEPEVHFNNKEADIRELIAGKFFDLIGQPMMKKPPVILATAVANFIFDKLLHNTIDAELLSIYKKWLDSNTYSESLQGYLQQYKISPSVDCWNVHPEHSFQSVDVLQLQDLTAHFRDKAYLNKKLSAIKKRAKYRHAPTWWKDILVLMTFNSKPLSKCDALYKVVDYYTYHFHQVDRAIRNIYATFLQDENIVRPLQEHYEALNRELLTHWFDLADEYETNQQGKLVELIQAAKRSIAIIVGDGVRYEIADYVATVLEKQYKVDKGIMLADMPSETEHNMSALYVGNKEVIAIHKEREKRLSEITGKAIHYLNLEELHQGVQSNCLVLTYKDIDSAGEKLQQGAIKLFGEFEKVLIEKIDLLLKMGYEVHLVTDHGFVLTGLLDEADKIAPTTDGRKEVHERFIRTVDKQNDKDWLCFDKNYDGFRYVYAAKSDKPFKSKGVYGFAHGGFTPQEIIIPHFVFNKKVAATTNLAVSIANKSDLKEVTGELFGMKLSSTKGDDLFSASRKVQIVFYANNQEMNRSHIITVEPNKTLSFDFSFSGNDEITAVLLDAVTQEQLDSTIIKKSNARDFGGLF